MKLIWSHGSKRDLNAIVAYIAQDSPQVALAQLKAIRSAADRLVEHPHMGRIGRVEGTRELVISRAPWIVIYEVRKQHVVVLRVRHAAQRWPL